MVATIKADFCTGCGSCIDECPAAAINLNEDDTAYVNKDECLSCGVCEDACPNKAISIE